MTKDLGHFQSVNSYCQEASKREATKHSSLGAINLVADLLNAAASGAESWQTGLNALSKYLDDAAIFLAFGDLRDPNSFVEYTIHHDAEVWSNSAFSAEQAYDPAINPIVGPLVEMQRVGYFDRRQLIDDAAARQNQFLRTAHFGYGLENALAQKLVHRGPFIGGGYIATTARQGPVEGDLLRKYQAIFPYLREFAKIWERIGSHSVGSLRLFLRQKKRPYFLVTSDLTIKERNDSAERYLENEDCFRVRNGKLELLNREAQASLIHQVSSVLYPERSFEMPNAVFLPRENFTVGLKLELHLVYDFVAYDETRGASHLITIEDPLFDTPSECADLLKSLDISSSEANVVRLVPLGLTKAEIAKELGLSVNTVKKHISHVLTKNNLKNQVHLAAVVGRLL